jgi:hypothetical protein
LTPLLVVALLGAACSSSAETTTTTAAPEATTATTQPPPTTQPPATTQPDVVESSPISSFDDIAGATYVRLGPVSNYLLFLQDGTIHFSPNTNLIVDDPASVHETRFEGTSVFMTTTGSMCDQPDLGGTYEVHVLESGNVAFIPVDEDTCELRSEVLLGSTDGEITIEFEPVP